MHRLHQQTNKQTQRQDRRTTTRRETNKQPEKHKEAIQQPRASLLKFLGNKRVRMRVPPEVISGGVTQTDDELVSSDCLKMKEAANQIARSSLLAVYRDKIQSSRGPG